jgi:transposase-like protein
LSEQKIVCPHCRSSLLAEWRGTKWSASFSFKCPVCDNDLQITGAPPIQIHRLDPMGIWRLVQTIGRVPTD